MQAHLLDLAIFTVFHYQYVVDVARESYKAVSIRETNSCWENESGQPDAVQYVLSG